jgi:hypothetical protein
MNQAIASSAVGRWIGRLVLRACPWEAAHCEERGCLCAPLCHAARPKRVASLWEQLDQEFHAGNSIWCALAIAAAGLLFLSFLW